MVEFYPDGESNHRSEKLDIKWSESLIAKVGKCICGGCRTTVRDAETLLYCPSPDCAILWKQVIFLETIVSFRHCSLPMFGKAVLPTHEQPIQSTGKPIYPFIGRRAVEDIAMTDGTL